MWKNRVMFLGHVVDSMRVQMESWMLVKSFTQEKHSKRRQARVPTWLMRNSSGLILSSVTYISPINSLFKINTVVLNYRQTTDPLHTGSKQ